MIVVDENKKELYRFFKRETDERKLEKMLYTQIHLFTVTFYFVKDAIDKVGGYRNIRFGEDWELWLRLGKLGKFYNFKEYFLLYLNSGQNFSINNQRSVGKTILGLIKDYKKDYPNYKKAWILNFLQYLYSFSPSFIKKKTQNHLFFIKRNYF